MPLKKASVCESLYLVEIHFTHWNSVVLFSFSFKVLSASEGNVNFYYFFTLKRTCERGGIVPFWKFEVLNLSSLLNWPLNVFWILLSHSAVSIFSAEIYVLQTICILETTLKQYFIIGEGERFNERLANKSTRFWCFLQIALVAHTSG